MFQVVSFYRFVENSDINKLRQYMLDSANNWIEAGLCGTILLAPEGINGTIAAPTTICTQMIDLLDDLLQIKQGEVKYSSAQEKPFNRFKIRLKKEIITLRAPEANPNKQVGDYVSAQDWNTLLDDPDVVLLDTRNQYETQLGSFTNAIDPEISCFTEFPEWVSKNLDPQKHKKVAMFCTGGIRCEKASAYMLSRGFDKVYHLQGGILKYLENIPTKHSRWQGECFVFDKRVSLGQDLEETGRHICYGCRHTLSDSDRTHPHYEEGVSCPHCYEGLTNERIQALRDRQHHFININDK